MSIPVYCPDCGSLLATKFEGGRDRVACLTDGCGYFYFGEASIGCGGVVVRGDRALLIQRGIQPGRGTWQIPGGYVEADEVIHAAVEREVSLRTHDERLSGDGETQSIGRLDLHFVPGIVHGTLVVSESLTQDAIQELMSMIDEDLTDAIGVERDDLVIHVHQGRDLGVFTHNDPNIHEGHGDSGTTTPPAGA